MDRSDPGSRSSANTVHQAAAAWFEAHQTGEMSDQDQAEFSGWLQADPAHEQAFRRLEHIWLDSPMVEDVQARHQRPSPSDAPSASRLIAHQWRRLVERPAALTAVAASLLLVISSIIVLPRLSPAEAPVIMAFATPVAQTRTVTLDDGSYIMLGGESEVTVTYASGARSAELTRGLAYFQVARDEARPFTVQADSARVTVLGTAFEVWHGPEAVRVSVSEGHVDVAGVDSRSQVIQGRETLRSGDRVTIASSGQLSSLAGFDPQSALAWREGRLTYSDATLDTVLTDINRYRSSKVRLDDPALAERRVTATLSTDEIDRFLQTLAAAEGLVLTPRDGETLLSEG